MPTLVQSYEPLAQGVDHESDDPLLNDSQAQPSNSRIRPVLYYGDGPFDPPSSDDEEEQLLEPKASSPGLAERGGVASLGLNVGPHKRPSHLRCLVISLLALVLLSGGIGIIAAGYYQGASFHSIGARPLTMDHVFNGSFSPEIQSLHWVPEAGDGVFSINQHGHIVLVDLKNNSTRNLVARRDIKDEHGMTLQWSKWQLSADQKKILIQADPKQQWRHSTLGNYYVHNLDTRTTYPITPPTDPPVTAYATWSPSGESIAFVAQNDIYIITSPSPFAQPIRITDSGNGTLFHGVPDWVYEEEVFASDNTLWWSPDSTKIAFLRLDETAVAEYKFPIYNPTENSSAVWPYTHDVIMKYPKPGYDNPLVSLHIFDLDRYLAHHAGTALTAVDTIIELDWDGRHLPTNRIIQEVAWVGNTTLIVKEVNRNADDGSVVLFDLSIEDLARRPVGRIVRRLGSKGEEGDDGWIDNAQNIRQLPASLSIGGAPAYLDVIPNADGYEHIALFNPASSKTPRFLTSGKWEVTGGIKAIDTAKGLAYFQAARSTALERHIYSVPIPTTNSSEIVEPTALTEDSIKAFYDVDFSPQGGFYLLSYHGPNVPWQKVMEVNNTNWTYVLTDNAHLNKTSREFEAPVISYEIVDSDGYGKFYSTQLNVMEMRPPRMDDSGRSKYPVLFRVYGGPNSQLVNHRFLRDWHDYIACRHEYIVVVVDGRGTGLRGRKFRNPVKGNLGFWETRDQVNVARVWAAKNYVDRKRIGIWGWSYGGFMTSKVLEVGAGIHTLGIAVAPVVSWEFYDSIYTERYMNLPNLNPEGYLNASISNVTAFQKADFLLVHGTGDDNVHFANTAHLLDMFTAAQVRNFRVRFFTDSDHSIRRRGAFRELYEYMTLFLVEKWGKGGKQRGW